LSSGIDTSGLGGQGWRRREGSRDAAGARARRWALRAGLVLAAGAAGLAVTAGSASADTGLGGTLDQVSSTVKKVTGGSSHASSTPKHSSGSKASAPRPATHSSARASVRTVVKPVVTPVARTVHRAAKPVIRVERAHSTPAVKPAPARTSPAKTVVTKATKATKATKQTTRRASAPAVRLDRAASTVSSDLLRASVRPAAVAAQVGPVTVSTTVLADVTAAVLPSSLDLTSVLPRLDVAVDVPVVDLGRVTLPDVAVAVGLPPVLAPVDLPVPSTLPAVPAPTPASATAPDLASTATAVRPSGSSAASSPTPAGLVGPRVLSPLADHVTASRTGGTAVRPVATAADAGLSLLTGLGAVGAGLGVAPDGSASTAGLGLALLALLAVAGPAGLTALRPCPVPGRHGHTSRLLRQPGFAPD